MHRCGVVAIAGRPNVGKSTIINRILGAKVAIVTPKPQTTRHRILGILTRPDAQILLYDTPGIHMPKKALNRVMVAHAEAALSDADAVAMVTDVQSTENIKEDALVIERVKAASKPTVLTINKIDLIPKSELLPLIKSYNEIGLFTAIVPVCALTGEGLDALCEELIKFIPEGPALYPDDELSDRPLRFMVAEIIREQVMLYTHQEIPYSTAVTIEEFIEGEPPDVVRISAVIHVERDSQKGIVIGRGGAMLKRIGTAARREIETMLDRKVFLQLYVKVAPNWAESEEGVRRLGY